MGLFYIFGLMQFNTYKLSMNLGIKNTNKWNYSHVNLMKIP